MAQPKPASRSTRALLRRLNLRRQSLGLVVVVLAALLLSTVAGLWDGLELSAVNAAFRLRGSRPPASPVVIVAIDDNTFALHRLQWPWPRTYFAQIVDRLAAGGAAVIAFDVFFNEPEDFGKPATYIVRGETLSDITEQYGVEAAALLEANTLSSGSSLCAGQVLAIPGSVARTHVVARDSLDQIAGRFGVPVADLLRINQLSDSCAINPGDLLFIPITGPVAYTVVPGDTVAGLAAAFQVNTLAIVDKIGGPVLDPLQPGQTLTVQFGDAALAASLLSAGNVILNGEVARIDTGAGVARTLVQPLPAFGQVMQGFGLTSVLADADGAVHNVLAWDRHPTNDGYLYSWPIIVAAEYLDQSVGDTASDSAFTLGGLSVPLEQRGLRVNYRGPEATIPTYSALQVVNGDLPPETFSGKIVLIGATSQSLHDVYATPFVPANPPGMPGVEIMANALDTLLSGQYLRLASGVCSGERSLSVLTRCLGSGTRLPALFSILLAGVGALALVQMRRTTLAVGTLLAVLLVYALFWLLAFMLGRVELPLIVPLLTLFAAFALPALERAVSEELEKRRVRGIFELFISPEMVGQLIEQGIDAMRGQRAELTVLFSDIRGFTTLSEKMTPEQLVEVLNEYLGAMTEVVHRNGGTVDKYEGDLVMAFFGAPVPYPDHAARALQTGIEMRQELDNLRRKWAAEGRTLNIEMGIGLNTGEVFVGLIGSGKRVNYTVMGDSVNLASRVQDLTKDFGWPFLITEFTHEHIKDQYDTEFLEARLVKGKTVPIGMYKVIGRKGAPDSERIRPLYA